MIPGYVFLLIPVVVFMAFFILQSRKLKQEKSKQTKSYPQR